VSLCERACEEIGLFSDDNRLPAGITFFGRAWDEATLIRLAYAYEQATQHRRAPLLC